MKKLKYMLFTFILLGIALVGYMRWNGYSTTDMGLIILTKIKQIKGENVNIASFGQEETTVMTHENWTQLLQKYVSTNGKVNYKGFFKDKKALEIYLDSLSNHPPGSNWDREERLSFWINVYNAYTVKLIIDHYPLKSIKDIAGNVPMINSPWDIKFFQIGGIDLDLNTVEHDILRKQFNEPRIHFAINCASFSCPKLRNEAFEADELESQLESQAIEFINNSSKNKISKGETQLSQIFSWFESDFKKEMPIKEYLKKYHLNFNEENTIEYLNYNWSLNE